MDAGNYFSRIDNIIKIVFRLSLNIMLHEDSMQSYQGLSRNKHLLIYVRTRWSECVYLDFDKGNKISDPYIQYIVSEIIKKDFPGCTCPYHLTHIERVGMYFN